MIVWRTEKRRVYELKDHPHNPRVFTEKGLRDLRKSIERIGFVEPIAINADNTILSGHARKRTLIDLDIDEIDVRVPDKLLPDALVREVLIRMNKNEAGVWDVAKLEKYFEKKELMKFGFEKSDFNSFPITQLAAEKKEETPLTFPIFSEEEIVERAFKVFRERGFPYPQMDDFDMMLELNKLASAPADQLERTNLGYAIADHFHKHRLHAAANQKRSPFEAFKDDKALAKAIRMHMQQTKTLEYKYLGFFSLVNGVQACSNFRPGYAKLMYDTYAPGGTVFDSSMGYGGRLVGFLASKAKKYIGTDPNTKSFKANIRLAETLGAHKETVMYNKPIEDLDLRAARGKCDLAFTSPPYFTKELYSDEDTQSCVRYPEYEDWREKFLKPMLGKQALMLRAGGHNIVNIEDVKIGNETFPLVADTIAIGKEIGLTHLETKKFALSHRMFGRDDDAEYREAGESVIIFKK